MDGDVDIQPGIRIPKEELVESHSRSGGPGGQSVNTSSTRVTLRWNIATSSLPETVRVRLLTALGNRLTKEGELIIHADEHRSQLQNREAARERLAATIRSALYVAPHRTATRPSRGSKVRRVAAKKARSETKRMRGSVQDD